AQNRGPDELGTDIAD
nr:EJf=low Mr zona pellucida binding protein {N-terminal} [swine, pH3 extract of ejaculated spermatozoa, Peptide Partial, 15 aa] [Sus scrofa]